jgi:hypothetical protein
MDDALLQLVSNYEKECLQSLTKVATIRQLPGGRWRVLSQKGKSLGTYDTKAEAVKRLRQVEYFKDHDKADDDDIIDLTDIDEFAYSAIMRKLRQEANPNQVRSFLKLFKAYFDRAVKSDKHAPEKVALQNAVVRFSRMYPVKLDKDMIKNAAVTEMGSAEQVGKYLANIVHFIINRVPLERRPHAIQVLKQKFAVMNAGEIAHKNLPQAAAYGQAITFVKHVLFNHDAHYIRDVLNSLSRSL